VPVVFRHGAFRIFFYSNEGMPREPTHVLVRRGPDEAKVSLEPVMQLQTQAASIPRH
jgi:hypothetical protein